MMQYTFWHLTLKKLIWLLRYSALRCLSHIGKITDIQLDYPIQMRFSRTFRFRGISESSMPGSLEAIARPLKSKTCWLPCVVRCLILLLPGLPAAATAAAFVYICCAWPSLASPCSRRRLINRPVRPARSRPSYRNHNIVICQLDSRNTTAVKRLQLLL